MKKEKIWYFFVVFMIFAIGQTFGVTFAEIKSGVKSIHIPEQKFDSFGFDMKMDLPMPLHIICQVRFVAPGSYTLRVFDASDKAPIMILADQKGIIYDPLSASVTMVEPVGTLFEMLPKGDQFVANFAFTMPNDKDEISNRIDIDLSSLFKKADRNTTASETNGTIFFSGVSEQGSKCKAEFDSKFIDMPRRLEVLTKENPLPVLSFDKFFRNEKIEKKWFVFPSEKLAKCGAKIETLKNGGIINTVMIVQKVMKAVFSRSAIKNVQLREQIEKMFFTKPDWKKIQAEDEKAAKQLKSVFQIW